MTTLKVLFPERIQIDEFDRNAHEVNLTMAPDGGFIILAMAREVDQPKDLYLCERLEDKHYSKPLPLWRVNTVWDEATPFISKDGQRLFFASDRPGGNGGKDIYYCDRQNTSAYQWKEAICLKPPVNTTFNEAHPLCFQGRRPHLFYFRPGWQQRYLYRKVEPRA